MVQPFKPSGTTKLINATTAGAVLTQVCTGGEEGVFISNPSTVPAYIAFGSSSIVAAVPTTGTPATGLCLLGQGERTFWMPGGAAHGYLDAISTAGTVPLFATPGIGL